LTLELNPHLYAELFACSFDIQAPIRRINGPELAAKDYAAEYKRRTIALRCLRTAVKMKDANLVGDQDLWTIYLMLLENDDVNLSHLTGLEAGRPLLNYLTIYHTEDLVHKATQPGYPPGTTNRALMLWIIWLLSDQASIEEESKVQLEELIFVLRPYVFAANHYDLSYGPWTIPSLPTSADPQCTSPQQWSTDLGLFAAEQAQRDPYVADLFPRSRLNVIELYGRRTQICAPIISHAGILNFFSRLDHSTGSVNLEDPAAGLQGHMGFRQNPLGGNQQIILYRPRRSNRPAVMTTLLESRNHDLDFRRLTSCWDANTSPGLTLADWRGQLQGCWEGGFVSAFHLGVATGRERNC